MTEKGKTRGALTTEELLQGEEIEVRLPGKMTARYLPSGEMAKSRATLP